MTKTQEFLKNVDKGFYHAARAAGLTPGQFVAQECEPEEPQVEQAHQRLLRRYRTQDDGGFKSQAIRSFAAECAALENCFAERRIRARGPASDTVEKAFFSSANDTALFPVFMANQLIAGILAESLVNELAATEERVDSQVAEKITLNESEGDRRLKFTGEGAALPRTTISRAEGSVSLYKYGRMLEWTYEVARRMRLNIISVFLQRMGAQIGIDETDDCIEVLLAGDGTASSAATATNTAVTGTLAYADLISFAQAFPKGYRLSNAITNDTHIKTILAMAEFKDPLIQVRFQENGGIDRIPMLGAILHRWTSTNSTTFSTDKVLGVDGRFALAILTEGDMLEESDALIDRQINRRTMSYWKGYMKLQNSATQYLDVTW